MLGKVIISQVFFLIGGWFRIFRLGKLRKTKPISPWSSPKLDLNNLRDDCVPFFHRKRHVVQLEKTRTLPGFIRVFHGLFFYASFSQAAGGSSPKVCKKGLPTSMFGLPLAATIQGFLSGALLKGLRKTRSSLAILQNSIMKTPPSQDLQVKRRWTQPSFGEWAKKPPRPRQFKEPCIC